MIAMRRHPLIGLLCLTITLFASCEQNKLYFAFKAIQYVDSFPLEVTVSDHDSIQLNEIGILDLAIIDSLLLISRLSDSLGYVSAYSTNNTTYLGSSFRKGRSEGEWLAPKFFSSMSISKEDDAFIAYLVDANNNLLMVDLRNSLFSQTPIYQMIEPRFKEELPRVMRYDDTTLFIKAAKTDGRSDVRFLWSGHQRSLIPYNCDVLNSFSVESDRDMNVLSTHIQYNREKAVVAEACLLLNAVHFYSLKEDVSSTVCIGNRLLSVNDVTHEEERLRKRKCAKLIGYDRCVAVLYLNETDDVVYSEKGTASLLFFSWIGEPLLRIKLTTPVHSFAIDTNKGCLYTLNRTNESILKWDISEALPK